MNGVAYLPSTKDEKDSFGSARPAGALRIHTSARETVGPILAALKRPVPALPVDMVRILLGTIGLIYFLDTLRASTDFSNPGGLIDHEIVRNVFWYTRLSAFPPGITHGALQSIFGLACLACLLLILGYRSRLMAVFLYIVAVSTYRWNFAVTYLDDATLHLVFFWLILLPTGKTLTITEWRSRKAHIWSVWKERWVPGVAVHCFLANIALLYLVAGLWKWTSPMWRDGSALYVALQMPVSYAPDFWTPGWRPVLMAATYGALVLEPILAVMFILPAYNRLKWLLLGGALSLHIGILATMKIPYTNAVLIAVAVLTFSEEIMGRLRRNVSLARPPADQGRIGSSGVVAVGFVVLLSVAMAGEITVHAWRQPTRVSQELAAAEGDGLAPVAQQIEMDRAGFVGSGHNVLYAPLWAMGIAQSYRLFDWVDERNWDIRYEVLATTPEGTTSKQPDNILFGSSIRHVLLQANLHGITWGPFERSDRSEFRTSLLTRYGSQYCERQIAPDGTVVDVFSLVRRITVENSIDRNRSRDLMVSFECRDGQAALTYVSNVGL